MPAPKKAGSARRSPATTKPGPTPGQTVNKDGTPRKKPGPSKGTPRGQKSVEAATTTDVVAAPKKRQQARQKKTFLLYAVDGNELSFVAEHPGATGQIAVQSAVKAGVLAPDTPYVFLTPTTVKRSVEVEAIPRDVQYKVKAAKPRRAARKPKTEEAVTTEPAVATEAAPKKTPSARKKAAAPAPPAPGETPANPFVQ